MHVGPTNSGKTHDALEMLKLAKSGVYFGPLRLLAHEVRSKLISQNINCDLITGEERIISDPPSFLRASTIEMADLNTWHDVAVLDEIQLIADPIRGWAWTRALLGLRAEKIILCGSETAVDLVTRICHDLNEKVNIHHHKRLNKLQVESSPINYSNIKKGDCVVVFSKDQVHQLRKSIREKTGIRPMAVYGSLPPRVRVEQARKFNELGSVLVATDAVGMGLNLNISRIVLSTLKKYNGLSFVDVEDAQIRQIVGRAGRFGIKQVGHATCTAKKDLKTLNRVLKTEPKSEKSAGLQPTSETIEIFFGNLKTKTLSNALDIMATNIKTTKNFFLCNVDALKLVADSIDDLNLPLSSKLKILNAPVPAKEYGIRFLKIICKSLQNNQKICVRDALTETRFMLLQDWNQQQIPKAKTIQDLVDLEDIYKALVLYAWIRFRFLGHDTFSTNLEDISKLQRELENAIDEAISTIN